MLTTPAHRSRLVLTEHATRRMLERQVARDHVAAVLAAPFLVRSRRADECMEYVGAVATDTRVAWLSIVVVNSPGEFRVVTVFWRHRVVVRRLARVAPRRGLSVSASSSEPHRAA
mgnify:CR=1 FL=1